MKRHFGNVQATEGLPLIELGEMINGWELRGTVKSEEKVLSGGSASGMRNK